VESDPGLSASGTGTGTADFHMISATEARVEVSASGPSIVVIRVPHAPGWRASVDGQPVRLLRADYLLQGVAVEGGRHTVELVYRDPWIGYGLVASALALAVLAAAAWISTLSGRRRARKRAVARPERGGE
jgi:uncharacterized membrane protein YfhO